MAARPLQRSAVHVLERIGRQLWGFPPRLMAPIVAELGALRALGWFVANMPRYELTRKAFGGLRTHLLGTAISLVSGCTYCTFGHGYALQLSYLQEHGELFPLDEHQLVALIGRPTAEIRSRLVGALERGRLHGEVLWLDRTFDLLGGEEPADRDEARIAHLIRMFAVLNAVGIADQTRPDQAHDPLNKDALLKRCYALMRSAPDLV